MEAEIFVKKFNATEQVDILENDIAACIQNKQYFVGFVLVALGIEYLGALLDDKEFFELGQSEKRFCKALKELFKNEWYGKNSDFLFKEFRGALLHQYRPGKNVELTHGDISKHLTKKEEVVSFVIEQFFADFKLAKNVYLKKKDTGQANKKKSLLDYMTVGQITSNDLSVVECPSGNTYTNLVQENDTTKKKPEPKKKPEKHKSKYFR